MQTGGKIKPKVAGRFKRDIDNLSAMRPKVRSLYIDHRNQKLTHAAILHRVRCMLSHGRDTLHCRECKAIRDQRQISESQITNK